MNLLDKLSYRSQETQSEHELKINEGNALVTAFFFFPARQKLDPIIFLKLQN